MNYINAHATSTLVGDVAEVKAIKKVFTDMSHVKVNGTKSLIGHCLGAAGGLEAVATIQAIRTGWLHPTLNQVHLFPHAKVQGGKSIVRHSCTTRLGESERDAFRLASRPTF